MKLECYFLILWSFSDTALQNCWFVNSGPWGEGHKLLRVNGWKQRILIVIIIVPVDGTYLFDNPFLNMFWLKYIEGYHVGESKKLCSLRVRNNYNYLTNVSVLFCFFFCFCFFVGTLSSYQALSIPKYINCWFYIKSTRTTSIFGAKKCCCLIKGLSLYYYSFLSIFLFCILEPPPFFLANSRGILK